MKEKILSPIIIFILLLVAIVFWEEYSFRKDIQLKTFDKCMARVPNDQDYETLKKVNVPRCLEVSK